MGKCARHPERETRFQCLKHGTWMCEECLGCRDPELYCKNRSACPIWYIEKRKKRHKNGQVAEDGCLQRQFGL
jgi:hypothetical protein